MLMTIGGLVVAGILFVISLLSKQRWLQNFVVGGIAVWFVFYVAMLFGFSFASKEKTLGTNEAKEFCGFYLDCHVHTAVTGVRTAKTLSDLNAQGQFYIVTVRVFSNAKRASLGLLMVDAHVVDAGGQTYARDMQAEAQLPPQPAFEKRISPVESFEKEIIFDLPENVQNPRLDIREGYGIDHAIEAVLVDDEDSIFHKRAYFALDPTQSLALN
jgi:Uncharacterized protein conserved in archaea